LELFNHAILFSHEVLHHVRPSMSRPLTNNCYTLLCTADSIIQGGREGRRKGEGGRMEREREGGKDEGRKGGRGGRSGEEGRERGMGRMGKGKARELRGRQRGKKGGEG